MMADIQAACDIIHDGAHWLHANGLWRKRDRVPQSVSVHGAADPIRRRLALMGRAREENARLAEQGNLLDRHDIARMLHAADPH